MKCVADHAFIHDFIKDWKTWERTLNERIQHPRKVYPTKGIETWQPKSTPPKKREILKELRDVRTPEERKVLATLIFKLV